MSLCVFVTCTHICTCIDFERGMIIDEKNEIKGRVCIKKRGSACCSVKTELITQRGNILKMERHSMQRKPPSGANNPLSFNQA